MGRQGTGEQAIHKAVLQHLRVRGTAGIFFFHCPNGGFRRPVEAAIFKALGVVAGVPDILVLWKGHLYGLELKAPGGKLSENQTETQRNMAAAGATLGVAWSLDEALGQLESWGLLRGAAQRAA